MHKFVAGAGVAIAIALTSVGGASADQIVVEVPHQVVSGIPAGAEFLLADQSVPPESQGLVCTGQMAAENNQSVHPGNDLRVSTGTSQVVLADVEGSPNKVTPLATPITLGSHIRIHLIMGPDERFSGGMHLELQCEPPPPPPPPPDDDVSPGGFSSPGGTTTVPPTTAVAGAGGQSPGPVSAQSPAPATPQQQQQQQLPATGTDEAMLAAGFGALLFGVGVALTALARRNSSAGG